MPSRPTRPAPPQPRRVSDSARIVDPRGRAKAYRPLPAAARAAAVERGLAAYERGAFYLAHEELEPAWMAAADPAERELLGGLIKLAAAYVHAARGNPAGAVTNLRGARERLAEAAAARGVAAASVATRRPPAGAPAGRMATGTEWRTTLDVDLAALLAAADDRLARAAALAAAPDGPARPGTHPPSPGPPHDVAGPSQRARRPPLDLDPPAILRRTIA